jgi:hypothetical protein
MVLDELWTALAGASGAALACCFVAAAVTLRWSRLRTARGAAARARQRQQAGLETMDKAAQRFRLQVTVVPGRGGGHDLGTWDRSTFSRSDAQRAGKRAAHMCAYPDLSFPQCIPQSLRQVRPEEERKRKGQGRSWRTIATLGQR